MPATEQIRKKITSLSLDASHSLEDAFRVHDDALVLWAVLPCDGTLLRAAPCNDTARRTALPRALLPVMQRFRYRSVQRNRAPCTGVTGRRAAVPRAVLPGNRAPCTGTARRAAVSRATQLSFQLRLFGYP